MSARRGPMRGAPALAAAVMAAAMVAGCASMAPPYERPAAPVAPVFPDETAAGAPSAVPAADIAWQQFFVDPRLKRLIELALQNNRDLRIAVLNIERVRAQYQIQRSEQFPTLFLGATGLAEPNTQGSTRYYTAGLNITGYELDLFGRVRSLTDAALQQYFASEAARKAAQISLVAAVANAYLTLLADDLQLDVTRKTLDTRLEELPAAAAEARQRRQLGLRGGAGGVAGGRGARGAGAVHPPARAGPQRAGAAGRPAPAGRPAVGIAAGTAGAARRGAGRAAVGAAGAPARRAPGRAPAAGGECQHRRGASQPSSRRITLTGSVGVASEDLTGLFSNRAWQFAPRITLPIFDAGANQANLERSLADRDIAVAQYERSIQTAFREVADSLAGRATLGEQLRSQQAQAQAEEQRFRLADLRFQNGASSYLDVLEAQRALFQSQQLVVITQAAQQQNLVLLYKALGGGWKE